MMLKQMEKIFGAEAKKNKNICVAVFSVIERIEIWLLFSIDYLFIRHDKRTVDDKNTVEKFRVVGFIHLDDFDGRIHS